ncbi:hypothetical protein D9M71_539710 [compost metagenome]
MITSGTIIGMVNSPYSSSRPGKRPRTRANALGRPSNTAAMVVSTATFRLASAASIHSGLEKNWPYHLKVQPGGGNTSHCDEPNDSNTMKTTGSSRKAAMTPVVRYRPVRSGRPMALGDRSMAVYLALPTGDSGCSFRYR